MVAQKRQYAIVKPMGNERILSAVDRLDRALARVEAAVGTIDARRSTEPAHDKLLERHRILRGQVEAAISRIDTLIAAAED